jgi:zinc protease
LRSGEFPGLDFMFSRVAIAILTLLLFAPMPASAIPTLAGDKTIQPDNRTDSNATKGAAAKTSPEVIVPDSTVRMGTLPNGLRYAVRQNKSPAGAVSIRLVLRVGSLEENEDELGYAHFIEHMAFRSTRQAPNGVLDNPFASLGVALGRDQNGATTLENTLYSADISTPGESGLGSILGWMRSAADGIVFAPAAVDTERGVVLAELQSRNDAVWRVARDVARFQLPGLLSASRDPGGSEESLRAATPAHLQAFYDRWYRPQNAFLVIVGDAPAETLEREAEKAFATWTGRGEAGVRPTPPAAFADRGLEAFTEAAEALPPAVSSCRYGPRAAEAASPMERLKAETLSKLWVGVLNRRLEHLNAMAGAPLLGALALTNDRIPDARGACLIAVPTTGKWKEALRLAQAELRRFANDGPTAQEVTDAVERLKAPLRGTSVQADTRASATVADGLIRAAVEDRVFTDPEEALRTFDIAAQGVTPNDLHRAFQRDWNGIGPLVSVVGPTAPTREEVLAAWRENEQAPPLPTYADAAAPAWPYQSFGRPGKVRSRDVLPDFVRLRFRNGTVLNFKQTNFDTEGIEIAVRFGHGVAELPADGRSEGELGTSLIPEGGLGKADYEQIGAAFASTTWQVRLAAEPTAFVMRSSPLRDQVDGELQLMAAYLTDPGFRTNIDAKLPTVIDFIYNTVRSDPAAVANDALEQRLFPALAGLPPIEQARAWRAADFERLLKPILTRSPVEVSIAGDISEEKAVAAVAASFGALPTRPAGPAAPLGGGPFRRFPDPLPPPITAYHRGAADKAAAVLIWPLYVAVPERRKEEHALQLVTKIMEARLFHEVRVRMGKVYNPAVRNPMPDYGDQGYLSATLEAAPADLDALVAAARRIAAEMAAGHIDPEELDRARQLLVAERIEAQRRNASWAGVISATRDESDVLADLTLYPQQMAALTLDEVRAAAAQWLKRDPVIARALPTPLGNAVR